MSQQIALHLVSVIPALLLGLVILSKKKGTSIHKLMGRIWIVLMLIASVTSFFIKSNGSFSWIHILSVITLVSIAIAIFSIRKGDIKNHRGFMLGAYFGAIAAGLFATIIPGRIVYNFFFGA